MGAVRTVGDHGTSYCRVQYLGILAIYWASKAKGSSAVNNIPSSGQLILMAETLKLFGLNPY